MSDLSTTSPASEIIARYGGFRALAADLGIPESTVRNWPSLGIPGKWLARLLDLSSERGLGISAEELVSATSRSAA